MMGQPLDALPIWAIYLLTVLVLLSAMELGYRLTKARQRSQSVKDDAEVGPLVGATLALLAFLLAFVVGFAANISNQRRQLVLQEANAIGTTYLRAGYLDEPYRTESKELLREYVDLRLAAVALEQGVAVVARSEEIHNELWAIAEQVAIESPLPTISLYISSVNDVIDIHSDRIIYGIDIRVPATILLGLYIVAIFTMILVGMQSGYAEKRNLIALAALVLILSVVFLLIVDLDRSQEGLMRVPQQALYDVQSQMNP
jgi:hypothetical protein